MATRKVYVALATCVQARENCKKSKNHEWFEKHTESIVKIVRAIMPSGGGYDAGTVLDLDASHPNRLVFRTSFHHMDDNGMYDGWTEHTVIVTPSLVNDFDLRITGRNRNEIKDYIAEVFNTCLTEEISKW